MNVNEIKAKAFDAVVTAYYGQKLSQTYVEALITFVNQFNVKEEEQEEAPESVTKATKEKPKKEPKAKEAKPVDKGKIKALYEAGWSVTKIADEMGLTGPTISYHIKALGLTQKGEK